MTVETLKACISADLSTDFSVSILSFNGTVLSDNTATLSSVNITSHEMLSVSTPGQTSAAPRPTAATSAALTALQSSTSSPTTNTEVLVDPSLRMEMLPTDLGPQQFVSLI